MEKWKSLFECFLWFCNYSPTLVEDKPDVIIIHVGGNDVTKQKMDTADPNKLPDDIIDIAKLCTSYDVKDITASTFYLNAIFN